jgi:hypothetical protein
MLTESQLLKNNNDIRKAALIFRAAFLLIKGAFYKTSVSGT